jgi:hypothetical protein
VSLRVYLTSKPGPYAQYDGHVDVSIEEGDDPFLAAVRQLRRTSFPDRGADCWKLVKVEHV